MSTVRNLADIRSRDAKLYEALSDIIRQQQAIAQQVNANGTAEPLPPPRVGGVRVTGQNGYLHVAIQDDGAIYRGIRYYVEHADNPHFSNPIVVPMHDSRNVTIPVGNQTRYVRVYSAYPWTAPSTAVYHGGASPIGVSGGGPDTGPLYLASEGSGTGGRGQGLQGPGVAPFRSVSGGPPTR